MPTYEYECSKCGLRFDRRQPMADAPLSECPECRGEVRRLVSGGVGFIVKGSGRSRTGQREGECSLERAGKTCCGRDGQTAVWGGEMTEPGFRYVYGPVPSRRLGRSLGLDLVPFKTCTYDCVYCQLGRTTNKTLERKEYVATEEILVELKRKLAAGAVPDYISLAGSGEPTLNAGIGDLIGKIQSLTDIPVAVLTNGSLLWMGEVQDALMAADFVLPSLDAGDEHLFRYVNRPHGDISFERMVDGIAAFTKRFLGEVWLEILLLAGVTGIPSEAKKIAALAKRIGPARAQLNTVSRPPAEEFVLPLSADGMLALKAFFPGEVDIIGESETDGARVSAFSEAREADVLALLRRRPCTSEDVAVGLSIHVMEALKRLEALIAVGKVNTVITGGRSFYTVTGPEGASRSSERRS